MNLTIELAMLFENPVILSPFVTFKDPVWCLLVVVEEEYIDKLDKVMWKVDVIGDYFGRIPEAVFLFLPEKYPETIFSKDKRSTLDPTMV